MSGIFFLYIIQAQFADVANTIRGTNEVGVYNSEWWITIFTTVPRQLRLEQMPHVRRYFRFNGTLNPVLH